MASTNAWTNPYQCPFCGDELASPGSGFVDHVDENPDCEAAFEAWRDGVTDDVPHGWPG